MIIIKSEQEIQLMRESGKVTGYILKELEDFIKPGISTKDINDHVEKIITDNGMIPTFKGYAGYPAAVCASINEEVVHGIPSAERILQEGDIISIDIGSTHKGYVSDAARTYAVGQISEENQKLIDTAKAGFFAALDYCRPGCRLSDIGHAVQAVARKAGLGVVRDYTGHGIGRSMHEDPLVPNYGLKHTGIKLEEGMVLAIEPMITLGTHKTRIMSDGWLVVTQDGKPAAHFEKTVAITADGPVIVSMEPGRERPV